MSTESSRPVLGITLGDAAGIGPELVAKIVADGFLESTCRPVVIGDEWVLEQGKKIAGVEFAVNPIAHPRDADFAKGVQFIETGLLRPEDVELGKVGAASGKASAETLLMAADYCMGGSIDGIAFAPLNKTSMKMGGYDFESEHALLAKHFGVITPYGEINVLDDFMTSRVTSHIAFKDICSRLTRENILDAIRLINDTLVMSGNAAPRLGVAALNPHNGENGTCGREEIDVIEPAVREARNTGINAIGPVSADIIFKKAFDGEFDAVVTMYHDQGQIATKLKGFERGITVAGGQPSPVATPAHGTAFDIAGKNRANAGPMKSVTRLVAKMAMHNR